MKAFFEIEQLLRGISHKYDRKVVRPVVKKVTWNKAFALYYTFIAYYCFATHIKDTFAR
jgi:hypothetical protein